jgi:hypothetical protein
MLFQGAFNLTALGHHASTSPRSRAATASSYDIVAQPTAECAHKVRVGQAVALHSDFAVSEGIQDIELPRVPHIMSRALPCWLEKTWAGERTSLSRPAGRASAPVQLEYPQAAALSEILDDLGDLATP